MLISLLRANNVGICWFSLYKILVTPLAYSVDSFKAHGTLTLNLDSVLREHSVGGMERGLYACWHSPRSIRLTPAKEATHLVNPEH